jgi:hypothetical protein
MKSRDGKKTLYGARVPEGTELTDTIEFLDTETKQKNEVYVRFAETVDAGHFSELDILSINPSGTIVYTWSEKRPDPLKTKE